MVIAAVIVSGSRTVPEFAMPDIPAALALIDKYKEPPPKPGRLARFIRWMRQKVRRK